jgi:hypothetical protein
MADETTTAGTERSAEVDQQLAGMAAGAFKDASSAIEKMEHDGTYNEAAAQEILHNAQVADAARQELDHHQTEQAKAADSGNIALAQENAFEAKYDINAINEHSLPENAHVVEAQADHNWFDQQHLETARQQEATAVAYDQSAASNAAAGDTTHALADAQVAADHHEVAAADTHAADAGGTYASHDSASEPAVEPAHDPSTEAAA